MSMPKPLPPEKANELLRQGALLVDIREPDEHARERIPGARLHPLSRIGSAGSITRPGEDVIIFHCASGARTRINAAKLAAAAPNSDNYVVEGGLQGWRKAGLPTVVDPSQPIELMRQVQIVAGSLVLTGVLLGVLVAPAFYGLSAFVGAGLLFAGATGFCGMARLLALMPWNRRGAAPSVSR